MVKFTKILTELQKKKEKARLKARQIRANGGKITRKKGSTEMVKLPGLDKFSFRFPFNIVMLFASRLSVVGKKTLGVSIFRRVLRTLREKGSRRPLRKVAKILIRLRLAVTLQMHKRGRKTYMVPRLVRLRTQYTTAVRWIISTARTRPEKGIVAKLVAEIRDISRDKSDLLKRRENLLALIGDNISSLRILRRRFRRRKKRNVSMLRRKR